MLLGTTTCCQSTNAKPEKQVRQSFVDVEITHPFHPWVGQTFLAQRQLTTGCVRLVRCITGDESLRCFPAAWTDQREVDEFERVSAGRCVFRVDDLEALRVLVDGLMDDH